MSIVKQLQSSDLIALELGRLFSFTIRYNMHFCKKNTIWGKEIQIEGGLHWRYHSNPLSLKGYQWQFNLCWYCKEQVIKQSRETIRSKYCLERSIKKITARYTFFTDASEKLSQKSKIICLQNVYLNVYFLFCTTPVNCMWMLQKVNFCPKSPCQRRFFREDITSILGQPHPSNIVCLKAHLVDIRCLQYERNQSSAFGDTTRTCLYKTILPIWRKSEILCNMTTCMCSTFFNILKISIQKIR